MHHLDRNGELFICIYIIVFSSHTSHLATDLNNTVSFRNDHKLLVVSDKQTYYDINKGKMPASLSMAFSL